MNAIQSSEKLLDGVIFLDRQVGSFTEAIARITIDDVSVADDSSTTLAVETIGDISHQAGEVLRIDFQVCGPAFDPQAQYSARVHIDIDGDRQMSIGDYITTQSYPVLTRGHPDWVEMTVEKII